MAFVLSSRSLNNLVGVDPKLVAVVKRAIELSTVDFAVTEGVRTLERQKQLLAKGATQTLQSKHIQGKAADLTAFIGTRPSWELNLYDNIADAMRHAAIELNVPVRWGGAWNIDDIRTWGGSMEDAMTAYVDARRKQGSRPFIDGPHFEIP